MLFEPYVRIEYAFVFLFINVRLTEWRPIVNNCLLGLRYVFYV